MSRSEELPEQLCAAVNSGTGIGGARPKALITPDGTQSMVMISVSTDVFRELSRRHWQAIWRCEPVFAPLRCDPKSSSGGMRSYPSVSTERIDDAADEMMIPCGTLNVFESSSLHDTVTRNLSSAANVGFDA